MSVIEIDCTDQPTRAINRRLRELAEEGPAEVTLLHPNARHNFAVALLKRITITIDGSVGYYCGGLNDGADIHVRGSAGWGTAESMMSGHVVVDGNAGNGAAAAIRGGTVVVRGNASARAGISMKGGVLVIGGNAGYMTGFMMQKGRIIICGDAGEALADSMYEGTIYIGGRIAELGNDAVVEEPSTEENDWIGETLEQNKMTAGGSFKRIVAGRKLWTFSRHELELWREAL
jgi:glutamate synthase domain-containing protein 3